MKNDCLKSLILAVSLSGFAIPRGNAADVFMLGNDANGPETSFNGAGQWNDFSPPSAANDYFVTNFFMRTPASASATTYTFQGGSLTLQAYAAPQTRSLIFKGVAGDVLIIDNFTNAAGSRIDQGSGSAAGASIGGHHWTIAGDSTLAADQGSPWTINSPLSGSGSLTNLGTGTITYNGTNSAFTGRFVLGGTTAKVILNSLGAVPGNSAAPKPDQFILGATSLLQDNVGVTYNNSNGGITLAGNATIRPNTAGSNTVIGVPIAGAFTLTKDGAGTLTLAGANTFGNLTLSGATVGSRLNINSATALGSGTFTIQNGDNATIDNTSGGPVTLTANNPMVWNNNFVFAGSANLNLGNGAVSMPGSRTINVNANTLTVGGVISGASSLSKVGGGILELGGANAYTGTTVINGGTLRVTGSLPTNSVAVNSGGTISGTGTVRGVSTVSGGNVAPGSAGVGTLAFATNLTFSAGSATFELSTSGSGGNDKVTVAGNLSLSSADTIFVSALSGAANLEASDYVLFQVAGTTTMSSTPALLWLGTTPANHLQYTIAKVGNDVVLKYTTATAPTVAASANPSSATRNQATLITAVVTPGSGAIASVTANLTDIGGSSTASLVLSNANVYTNTFVVGPGVAPGASYSITVMVTDNTSPVPLTGNTIIPFTVTAGGKVWDGGSLADDNWTSNPNWTSDIGPGFSGDSVTFAGSARLTPNLDANYSVTGVTFDAGAGSFNIGTANGSVLTVTSTNGIVNNSTAAQSLNVPVVLGSSQTINAAAGNIAFGGPISGAGGLTKTGSGTVTLTGSNSYTGNLFGKAGAIVIDSGSTNRTTAYASIGQDGSDVATLTLKGTGAFGTTADFNVGDIGAASGVVNIQDNAYLDVNALFIGSANASGSSAMGTVNQSGGTVVQQNTGIGFFTIGGRSSATTSGVGIYNLSGGTLIAKSPVRMSGYGSATVNQTGGTFTSASGSGGINLQRFAGPGGTYNLDGGIAEFNNIDASVTSADPTFHSVFNFNGGTLKPTATRSGFMPAHLSRANVRNGGAIIDTAGFDVSIEQVLQHSDNGSDNATDGGLTKKGLGTLTLASLAYDGYTGPTKVLGGTLVLNTLSGAPYTGGDLFVSNAVLRLDATYGTPFPAANVTVQSSAVVTMTNSSYASTISGTGNMTLAGGATLNFNFGELYGANPTAAAINVSGSLSASGVTVINISGSGFAAGASFPLIDYTGAAVPTNNFMLGSLPPGVTAVLTNNAANTSLDLLITLICNQLTWHGASADNSVLLTTWDIGSSANWYDNALNPVTYAQYNGNAYGDLVTFADYGYNTDGTNSVNLSARVVPSRVNVNSFTPYRLTGSGGIDGTAALVVDNASPFFLGTSNNFTGGAILNGGMLAITNDSALGASSGSLTLAGGTLELDGSVSSARSVDVTAASSFMVPTNVTFSLNGLVAGTNASLNKLGEGTLNISSNVAVAEFNFENGVGNLTGNLTTGPATGLGRLRVGRNGTTGILNVQTGANLTVNWSVVPGSDSATGTINVNGGTVVHQGGLNFYLGSGSGGSTGFLNLNSGAISNLAGGIIIGEGGASVGAYNQSGGSALLGDEVRVGQSAANNQFNLSGGTASTTANLLIGYGDGSGAATLSGGTLSVGGLVQIARGTSATSLAAGTLTVSNSAVLNIENDLVVAYAGAATEGRMVIDGGTVSVASTNTRWLILGQYDTSRGTLNVNKGQLKLNANTSLKFSTGNGSTASTNVVNLNGGAITFYGDNGITVGGSGIVDLAQSGSASAFNTFNLNGGTLTAPGVGASSATPTRIFNFNGGTLKAAAGSTTFLQGLTAANVQAGGAIIDTAGYDVAIAQPLLDAGGGLTKNGAGTLALDAANTYSAATVVNDGLLGGNGTIAGPVTINANAGLAPGSGGIGTLTINGNLAIAANTTNVFEVNGSTPVNDSVALGAAVTYGGVLRIVPTGTFSSGQTFALFTGAGAVNAGNFVAIEGSPGSGLAFNFTNGVLSVVSGGVPAPAVLTNAYSGGVLSLSWPAGQGWRLQMQTNSVMVGLNTNWMYITDGSVSSTNIVTDATKGSVFYRLVYP